jgi:FtsP/CotA-like multicopper oxidase with cupredoxin domain
MLTRREMMKLGLLSGGYTLLDTGSGVKIFADDDLPASPRLTPFVDPLPLPPAPPPLKSFREPDGRFIQPDTNFCAIVEEEAFVSLHRDLRDTKVWRYHPCTDIDGTLLEPWGFCAGPTLNVGCGAKRKGGMVVRMLNRLNRDHVGFGVPETTTHFHGGHHPAASDGFPENTDEEHPGGDPIGFRPVIGPPREGEPPEHYDYVLPMLDPGFSEGRPQVTERPSTMWYHDHLFDFTGANVVRGLSGFYLVFDEKDSGDETDLTEGALRLPSGPFDVPLVVQDRRISSDGQLMYDALEHDGFLGDTFLVNGKVQPFLDVQRRKYRFRFLNGSNARHYRFFLNSSNGATVPMTQIATEGGLLSAPIWGIQSFQIAPAERVEVVVDFRNFDKGTRLYFENRLEQDDGRKPDDVLSRGTGLLQLRVQGDIPFPDNSRVPDRLRPFERISDAVLAAAPVKEFKFDRSDGAWTINGELADLAHPLTSSVLGKGEIWHLDSGGGWAHPVHIHLDFMRILRRDGELPRLGERDGMARKDTTVIGADFKDVDIFIKFNDYPGPFVFHCHNIEHEDMRMMARIDMIRSRS